MTISTCMDLVDSLVPNGLDRSVKLRLLGEIEGKVRVELLGGYPEETEVFGGDTPDTTELTVPHPYDQLYWTYMIAMMEYMRGDVIRYENAAALFNTAYQGYAKWLKRQGV